MPNSHCKVQDTFEAWLAFTEAVPGAMQTDWHSSTPEVSNLTTLCKVCVDAYLRRYNGLSISYRYTPPTYILSSGSCMDIPFELQFDLTTFMQVIFIDLVLSGDNAIIIGMAAASLPPALRRKAIVWGIALAVVLRVVLAALTVYLLTITGLKLVGGLLLFVVCYQLWKDLRSDGEDEVGSEDVTAASDAEGAEETSLLSPMFIRAMLTIIVADVSMSLDNVLGVAGAAKDNVQMLVFGLVLSIVLMAIGANLVARMLNRYQWIGYIGLAVIVWVAGEMTYIGTIEVYDYLRA